MGDMYRPYLENEAREYVERHGHLGEDLALRIYTSQLLGREPKLVLHGGGNTSVKTRVREITGEEVDVLYVKGSGWDLADIEPVGFPACRLSRLLRLTELESLSDEEMVAQLRGQMLDPSSPTPSVEALLHALIPHKFVDHTHANAVLSILDRPDSQKLVDEIWQGRVLLLPYVMPGFMLARAVRSIVDRLDGVDALLLDKHGIFTWGNDAKESYERMIETVRKAEQWLCERRTRPTAGGSEPGLAERREELSQLAPRLRGAMTKAAGEDGRMIAVVSDHPDLYAIACSDRLLELLERGPITPDHVIRTRPFPLVVAADDSPEALEATVSAWGERYHAWVDRGIEARGVDVKRLDSLPRMVFVKNLGAIFLGKTIQEAMTVRDLAEHSARVLIDIAHTGEYQPVSETDLFDIEYWSLEQAKLKRQATKPGRLARRIALVTGAASGIGRATAEHMLAEGAHVLLVDRAGERLHATHAELAKKYGPRVAWALADLDKADEARSAVAACVSAFGCLDVLVSNAGSAPVGRLDEQEGELELERSLRSNLLSHQWLARASADVMKAQGLGGVLLFNASKAAFNPGPAFGPYAVAKAALVALMRQLAIDLGEHGIRANAVNADRVRTSLFDGGVLAARAKARGLSEEAYFRANLLSRETTADDVAEAFVYLATAEATTGCVLTVDGGNAAAFPR